jgi:hypothetical protein
VYSRTNLFHEQLQQVQNLLDGVVVLLQTGLVALLVVAIAPPHQLSLLSFRQQVAVWFLLVELFFMGFFVGSYLAVR